MLESLPAYFESNQIHIAALVTASYSGEDYSHYLAKSSLGTWLKEQGIPAIYGVDTRALTKKLRAQGSMLGKLLIQKATVADTVREHVTATTTNMVDVASTWRDEFESVEWVDPNTKNLVAEGSEPLYTCPNYRLTSSSLD